jgi:hypothetical protein
MNRWDIDNCAQAWKLHPILGPATRTMVNLRDAADANSDGWAYWPKPARAARQLMELIERDGTWEYSWRNARHNDRPDVTREAYKRALVPIKAFRTRTGLPFDIEELS